MSKRNNYVRRTCMIGMLAALYLALNLVGFRAWSFHITFASLPVLVGALLFGPVEGMLIALIGEFFNQVLSYGITVTTVLWLIPPAVRGLTVGGAALALGYRRAYLVDIGLGTVCLMSALRLQDVGYAAAGEEGGKNGPEETVWKKIFQCFRESVRFLLHSRKAMELILLNAAVGAAATLLRFFLQARLTEKGLPDAMLGPALFFMGLGGAAGARLILHCKSWSYGRVFAVSAIAVAGCVAAALLPVPAVMVFGGFLSALFDNFLQVRSDVRLNEMVPAGQRATLISVSSLCFSGVMIVLSPLFGLLFS